MPVSHKPLLALTAADLMTQPVVWLTEDLPLREAARRLLRHRIGGAPVVDAQGRCIGVLSALDFLRLAQKPAGEHLPEAPTRTCIFQEKYRLASGEEVVRCLLPPGACPLQVPRRDAGDREVLLCSQPHSILCDWQVVTVESLPTTEVRYLMTPDPVTVSPETPIGTLARLMIDAHIHRLIVVDDQRRPIGIVSSTDLLAALARAAAGGAAMSQPAEVPHTQTLSGGLP
jgi:CBS domain-containing protein